MLAFQTLRSAVMPTGVATRYWQTESKGQLCLFRMWNLFPRGMLLCLGFPYFCTRRYTRIQLQLSGGPVGETKERMKEWGKKEREYLPTYKMRFCRNHGQHVGLTASPASFTILLPSADTHIILLSSLKDFRNPSLHTSYFIGYSIKWFLNLSCWALRYFVWCLFYIFQGIFVDLITVSLPHCDVFILTIFFNSFNLLLSS